MNARAYRADDVATVELSDGEEMEGGGEDPDPGGAADGVEEQVGGLSVRLKDSGRKFQDDRHTEDEVGIRVTADGGNDFGMNHSVSQCRQRHQESHERPGSADVE